MWEAVYKDGSTLKQFEENKEKLFKDIDQEKLGAFILRGDPEIAVNTAVGIFFLNGIPLAIPDVSYKEDLDYRLIYFKRVRKVMGSGGGVTGGDTETFFIGFQTTVDGKNHKYMLSKLGSLIQAHF